MGRRGPKPAKQTAIAKAALALFVERGVKGATTRAIAQRARSTESSLYRHYSGKDALARHVLASCLQTLASELEAGMARAHGARSRLRGYVQAYVEFGRRHPLEHAFLQQAHAQDLFGALETVPRPRRLLSGLLAEGQASGEFHPIETRWLAAFLAGGLGRVCYAAWGRDPSSEATVSIDALADLVERMVGCAPAQIAGNGHAANGRDSRGAPEQVGAPQAAGRWNGGDGS